MLFIYLGMLETGDEKAKFTLIYKHYDKLLAYIAKNDLIDKAQAEDAMQDMYIKVITYIKKVGDVPSDDAKAYLTAIMRSVVADYNGVYKIEEPIDERRPDDASVEDESLSRFAHDDIVACICGMDENYSRILYLKYVKHFSSREISGILKIPLQTVYTKERRGRMILTEKLKREGYEYVH